MAFKQLDNALLCIRRSLDFGLMELRIAAPPRFVKSLDGKCLLVRERVFLIPHHNRPVARTKDKPDSIPTKPVIGSAKRSIERPFIDRDFSNGDAQYILQRNDRAPRRRLSRDQIRGGGGENDPRRLPNETRNRLLGLLETVPFEEARPKKSSQ